MRGINYNTKRGFIDLSFILWLVVLLILVYAGMRYYQRWENPTQSKVTPTYLDNIKKLDLQNYLDEIKRLSDRAKDRIPEGTQEIKDRLKNRMNDPLMEYQTPETLILTEVMKRCLVNGEVSPECRRVIDQYTDMVIPDNQGW